MSDILGAVALACSATCAVALLSMLAWRYRLTCAAPAASTAGKLKSAIAGGRVSGGAAESSAKQVNEMRIAALVFTLTQGILASVAFLLPYAGDDVWRFAAFAVGTGDFALAYFVVRPE